MSELLKSVCSSTPVLATKLSIISKAKIQTSFWMLNSWTSPIPSKKQAKTLFFAAQIFTMYTLWAVLRMKQSKEGAYKAAEKLGKKPPLILAVTVLTSISQEVLDNEIKVNTQVRELAINLAKLAKEAGLDGVVASVHELRAIKEACGEDFKVLCPGIRPLWSLKDDQKRIATPAQALKDGADFLVIGRAVTAAEDRVEAMKKIYEETGVI